MDQPIQVGYSHGSSRVSNTDESAKATYAFLQLFFEEFPEYADNDFHISGESYAGHYLPALGKEIIKQKQTSTPPNFNLDSVIIGNGWTDPLIQNEKYIDFGCNEGKVHAASSTLS